MAAESSSQAGETVDVPSPTAWPMVFAFGLALGFAGLATTAAVSLVGVIAAVAGAAGWFRAVLPKEAHRTVPREAPAPPIATLRREVVHLHVLRGSGRAWLPVEIYPITAGLRGGLAGGAAMAIIACLYGILSGHGIWYPVNLLAAGFLPGSGLEPPAQIERFQASSFALACGIHLAASLLVGLLYGALLPILPRRPVLFAGFAAPVLWTALLHSIIGVLNPLLNQRVDWLWFVVSQVAFGIVAGLVVSRQERIRTWQGAPLAVRAGIAASGMPNDSGEEEKR